MKQILKSRFEEALKDYKGGINNLSAFGRCVYFIKNKIILVTGVLFFIIALIGAVSIWFFGIVPLKHRIVDNTELHLKYMAINRNIRLIKTNARSIIYYYAHEEYKPLNYKNRLKKVLAKTKTLVEKTDSEYKKTAAFIKKTAPYAGYSPKVVKKFKKSYSEWEISGKPEIERLAEYAAYMPPVKSQGLFSKYIIMPPLSSSILPSKPLLNEIVRKFRHIYNIYLLIFIFGTFIIAILITVIESYLSRFLNTIVVEDNERRLKSFFNKTPSPSLIIDVETGLIIDANEKAVDFYGYSKEEFAHITMAAVNPFATAEETINFREKALKEGYNFAVFKHRLKNGDIKNVEAYISGVTYSGKPYIQAIINDITDRKVLEDKLKESEEMFRALADNMPISIAMHNDKYIYVNPQFINMFGYTEQELKSMDVWEVDAQEYREAAEAGIKRGLGDINDRYDAVVQGLTKSGKRLWMHIFANSVRYKGEIVRIASFLDITEMVDLRKILEQERDLLKVLIENIHSGIALYNRDKFLYANVALLDLFNYTKEKFLDLSPVDFFSIGEEQIYNLNSGIFQMHHNKELSSRIIYRCAKGGRTAYIDLFRTAAIYNNEYTGLAIFSDVTAQIIKEQSILTEKETYKELSERDGLTGINNRRSFDDKLSELLHAALRYARPLSLIMFDIDHFKDINDTYGHETGDAILKGISAAIGESLRATDFFARFGGEEFMIIAPETPLPTAKELAERLRLTVEKRDFKIGRAVTCSFGVTEARPNDEPQSIAHRADTALYEAKNAGRNLVFTD